MAGVPLTAQKIKIIPSCKVPQLSTSINNDALVYLIKFKIHSDTGDKLKRGDLLLYLM